MFKTTDLCDEFDSEVSIADPIFHDFGGVRTFGGPIVTVKVFEDNAWVRQALEQPGEGRVLVVDGGGSTRCALVGDQLAQLGQSNGWAGIVVHGCIRDADDVARIPIGVKALATCPRRSVKKGSGERDVPVRFAGIVFQPRHYVYADVDGIIVAARRLA